MRVLITGGAGFLGSHLCERFLNEGWEVTAIDNYITGSDANIAHLLNHPHFTLLKKDITRPLEISDSSPRGSGTLAEGRAGKKGSAAKFDWILHFASPASPKDYLRYPLETLRVGSLGTLHVLELAQAHGAHFFLASSSEVYGDPKVHPQDEEYWGNVNPIGPRSVYDEGKRFSEALSMAYHRSLGLEIRIARIFNTYGPRMKRDDGRVIPNFINQALRNKPLTVNGDGSQTRSFCYVDDLIEGIFRLMNSNISLPINLGNPTEICIMDLAKRIRENAKSKSEIIFHPLPTDDPKVRRPDIQKASDLLGWSPRVGLDGGLEKTILWFRSALHED